MSMRTRVLVWRVFVLKQTYHIAITHLQRIEKIREREKPRYENHHRYSTYYLYSLPFRMTMV